jgi:hypothetical protein
VLVAHVVVAQQVDDGAERKEHARHAKSPAVGEAVDLQRARALHDVAATSVVERRVEELEL